MESEATDVTVDGEGAIEARGAMVVSDDDNAGGAMTGCATVADDNGDDAEGGAMTAARRWPEVMEQIC